MYASLFKGTMCSEAILRPVCGKKAVYAVGMLADLEISYSWGWAGNCQLVQLL